jgi:plastocyanin
MLHRVKRLGLALLAAGSLSLLSLVPAVAQSAYPGSPPAGYGRAGSSYSPPRSQAQPAYGYGSAPRSGYGNGSYPYSSAYASRSYTVVRGDTLQRIAARFGVTLRALLNANPTIYNPNLIFPGQRLAIPTYGSGGYGSTGGYTAPAYTAPAGSSDAYKAPGGQMGGYSEEAGSSAAAAAPQPAPAPGSTPGAMQQTVTLNLVARNMAFDQSTLTAPAGAHVIVRFSNRDAMPHNLAVYTDASARQAIFQGQIVMGPNSATYEFDAPGQPGTYFFRCDVHPTLMTGQFVVQ